MIRGETQYNPVSRFLKEIPPELLDNKVPEYKNKEFANYDENSIERSAFKQKPFYNAYGSGYGNSYTAQKPQKTVLTNDVFDKKQASFDGRPKAVLKKKITKSEVQPYMSKAAMGIAGLSKGIPQSEAELSYGVGDRVRHVKFGVGTVENIEKGPRDYQVTVLFDSENYGKKVMYAAFAKLQKISEDEMLN
jgi:DNA helicase-2/ATP-dependent DNA helicase PcrA